jgi:prophage antirepressor-like protein
VRLIAPRVLQPEILDDPDELPAAWAMAAEPVPASPLAPFAYDGRQVRVITDEQGMPWFVAADVLGLLGLDRKAMERLDSDERGVSSIHTPGGHQSMTTVNESGLYSLILGSRKPEARAFKRWVTHEVLPAIRRTGRYALPSAPAQPQLPPGGPAILIRAKTHREAAQVWADALEEAAASAIRRRYSVRHRGPDTLSLPACIHWQHVPA